MLVHFLQKSVTVRTDVELEEVFAYFKSDIGVLGVSYRVDEGLIEVKNEKFLFEVEFYGWGKRYLNRGRRHRGWRVFFFRCKLERVILG